MIEDLRKRLESLSGIHKLHADDVSLLENKLDLVLPNDFKRVSVVCDGAWIGLYDVKTDSPAFSILTETLRLREAIKLPTNFVVLAEPAGSLIILDCNTGKVIWLDDIDALNLTDIPNLHNPDVWNDYITFFSDWLKDAEEEAKLI